MRANPIIIKELKVKMRGWKSPALITAYLGFLALVALFYFATENQFSNYRTEYFNPRMALNGYRLLATMQFFLILLITPALTAGAISGERERQTLDLLLCTNLSPFSIVIGKVVVSIAHILLLVTASIPIMGMVFLFGGVTLADILLLFAYYVTTAFMLGSLGIFLSSIFRKSSVSLVTSYVIIGAMTIGTMIALVLWRFVLNNLDSYPTTAEALVFMSPNFLIGFFSIVELPGGMYLFNDFIFAFRQVGWGIIFARPWIINMVFSLAASAVFILLAARRIKPLKTRIIRRHKKAGRIE